jgi:hypothetical protein
VRAVARARTLTLLNLLSYGRLQHQNPKSDASRKRDLIRFLYEANLI